MMFHNFYCLVIICLLSFLLNNKVQASQNGAISNSDGFEELAFSNQSQELGGKINSEGFAWDLLLSNVQPRDNGQNLINHFAAQRSIGRSVYAAEATLNVYGLPNVGANQSSAALVWVANGLHGPRSDHNIICAGWQVAPKIFGGDHDTHLVVYWTADGGQTTGCPNLGCKGFVPYKGSKYVPGAKLRPLSTYNGDQYDITIKISKDSQTGDWWLHVGRNGEIPVGHWPKSLFTTLADFGSIAQIGGSVSYPPNEKSPPMGSGHFPDEGLGKAAYLRDVFVTLGEGQTNFPLLRNYQDKTDCYLIGNGGKNQYYFGGPGGCTD